MKKVIILLALGPGASFVTSASAAPLSRGLADIPDNGIENVRRSVTRRDAAGGNAALAA